MRYATCDFCGGRFTVENPNRGGDGVDYHRSCSPFRQSKDLSELSSMTFDEYRQQMHDCGFPDHEIESFWNCPNPLEVLEAALIDGERDLSPGD